MWDRRQEDPPKLMLPTSKNYSSRPSGGFVLIYTVVIVTILLITVLSIFSFVSGQIKIARDEIESAKALYAADTGIECVRYYQNKSQDFNTTQPEHTVDCGVGTLTAGIPSPGTDCIDKNYATTTLSGFSNGSCTLVTVTVRARSVTFFDGSIHQVCDLYVISNGRNTCAAGAQNLVERGRWESIQ